MKKPKVDREYPSLSILCSLYEACKDPEGLAGFYGAVGTAQAEAYSQACADLGDRIHKYLEEVEIAEAGSDIKAIPMLSDPREMYMAALLLGWAEQSGMKAVPCHFSENGKAIEVPLNSKLLDFSCRVDRVSTFGNDPTMWVLDYKTSKAITEEDDKEKPKESYCLQLCGYSLGWFERTGNWIDQGVLVRVEKSPKKNPQLEVVPVYNLHEYLEPLVLLRQMWDFIHGRGVHDKRGITSTGLLASGLEHRASAQGLQVPHHQMERVPNPPSH